MKNPHVKDENFMLKFQHASNNFFSENSALIHCINFFKH